MENPGTRTAWETAPVLDGTTPDDLLADEPFQTPSGSYWECGHTGWDLMLAWLAGPESIARFPDTRTHHWQVAEEMGPGTREYRLPILADELAENENAADEYLRDGGVPDRRPRGYRWFQLLPEGWLPSEIHAAAHRAIAESGVLSGHPRDLLPIVRVAIGRIYGSDTGSPGPSS
ncbi:hypothetical protein EV385_4674 [Krasilnikovia cinnamomea]|uniref:Uncharacterized protein n=1 Tax=Krasilnikovia cinnamomea TaxID=349313 RepID=A0A4Q7ZP18_9ACTN|nr:DUF5956 family protein [Krasilnikovia cinnamomea]RZU52790.1 hypothetical protein EV385_4674 [Krasilnikovia cinnamomea]